MTTNRHVFRQWMILDNSKKVCMKSEFRVWPSPLPKKSWKNKVCALPLMFLDEKVSHQTKQIDPPQWIQWRKNELWNHTKVNKHAVFVFFKVSVRMYTPWLLLYLLFLSILKVQSKWNLGKHEKKKKTSHCISSKTLATEVNFPFTVSVDITVALNEAQLQQNESRVCTNNLWKTTEALFSPAFKKKCIWQSPTEVVRVGNILRLICSH